jgi:iron complex transport system substrate-binding protein
MHRELGSGLLESVYEIILAGKLAQRGIEVARQVPVSIDYDVLHFEAAFRIDLLVGGTAAGGDQIGRAPQTGLMESSC